ncbi:hypothetical protein KIPB_005600 [Kipferlia bialata]|uniref:GIY-YIG domain-containing protein n=1 Tax=Kipferlia bialata TaxID=797122 RepID=A0A9K3CXM8_9EUKA|nr:hypothetical protein KIPB_005600 [Kipferlia bialata]|eukprot:g5600.t1
MPENYFYVYVLRLAHGKYYVGKTTNVKRRLVEHRTNKGAAFTREHRVLGTVPYRIHLCSNVFAENMYTIKYMSQFGIDNVRGGMWTRDTLTLHEREHIVREIATATDRCYLCLGTGHMAAQCPKGKDSSTPYKTVESGCRRCLCLSLISPIVKGVGETT